LDTIEEEDEASRALVVTHGAFMTVVQRELRRRGDVGKRFVMPRYGRVYMFRKPA